LTYESFFINEWGTLKQQVFFFRFSNIRGLAQFGITEVSGAEIRTEEICTEEVCAEIYTVQGR
jgi:hypothetical protein